MTVKVLNHGFISQQTNAPFKILIKRQYISVRLNIRALIEKNKTRNLLRKFLNLVPTLWVNRSQRLRSSIITYETKIALADLLREKGLRILLSIDLPIDELKKYVTMFYRYLISLLAVKNM